MNWKRTVLISSVLAGLTAGVYLFLRQFQSDRESAMNYQEKPVEQRPFAREERLPDGRTVTTYTAEDLEEARKKGQLPKGMDPASPAAANDAAIQRTLRTIDEINKVNEMNRRLQEQQQRNNK